MMLRTGPTPKASERARAAGPYYESLGPSPSIILKDGFSTPLATGPRPMDVLDRCRAFHLPALSTQHTYKGEK